MSFARHDEICEYLSVLFEPQLLSAHIEASRLAARAGIEILRIPPGETCGHFVYLTCGMSDRGRPELAVCTGGEDPRLLNTLFAGARRHLAAALAAGDVFALDRPCVPGSLCDHAVVFPTAHCGFDFGQCRAGGTTTSFLWLLPITAGEASLRERQGADALVELFQSGGLDVVRFDRPSLAAEASPC